MPSAPAALDAHRRQSRTREVAEATYTRLVRAGTAGFAGQRLVLGGLGTVRGNDFSGTRAPIAPGIQLDYETTRVYVSASGRLYRAEDLNHDFGPCARASSFYEAEYDEIQPWLVVEARRMRGLSGKTEITPMLRLINKRYFIEAGMNNSRQARFNFMYIF